MIQTLLRFVLDLTVLTVGAVVLFAGLRMLGFLVRVLPVPTRLRETLRRFAPVLGLTVLVAYAAASLTLLYLRVGYVAVLVLAALVAFGWAPLYDVISGVAFRFGGSCREGDQVKVGDVEGRVLEVGMRSLVVQTRQGDEAVVPYGKIIHQTLRRTQSLSGAHVHAFVIEAPAGKDFSSLKRDVIQAAVRCHWASVVHAPKVERREGNTVEVSVYALDADHAPLVESAVRASLGGQPLSTAAVDRLFTPSKG